MITIVNYGLGNAQAFANAYKRLNVPAKIASKAEDLRDAERIVLPGVGAFDCAMKRLEASGMRDTLDRLVKGRGVPVLGICVGMQMLATSSDEGVLPGLGWLPGKVVKLDARRLPHRTHLPHMGWNDVSPAPDCLLFRGLETGARFYFLHSYCVQCEEPKSVIAYAEYGERFCCAVKDGHIHGVQFHPEKSHHFGARLLKNFAES